MEFSMAVVFTVIALSPTPHQLESAIKQHYPNDHLPLREGAWLVAANGVAKPIAETLGLSDGSGGLGVVFSTSGFFGYADNSVWEWLTLKLQNKT